MVVGYMSNHGKLSILESKNSIIGYDRNTKRWLNMNRDLEEILLLCQGKLNIDQILRVISEKHGLNKNEARSSVLSALDSLEKDKIVVKKEKKEAKPIRLRKYAFQFPLISSFVEATKRCNLECSHCYNSSSTYRIDELSRRDFSIFLEQTDEMGVFNVFFTGGEPFVRQDFMDMLYETDERNLETGILTNGTLLNYEMIKKLREINPKFVAVSLESIDSEKYRKIRKIGNAQVIKNILKMKEEGINVRINRVLFNGLNDSYEDIKDFLSFFKERGFKQEDIAIDEFLEMGRGKVHEEYSIRDKSKIAGNFKRASRDVFQRELFQVSYQDSFQRTSFCGVGESILYLTSKADITLCTVLTDEEFKAGNIKDTGLREIWENASVFNYFREGRHIKDSECEECSKLTQCAGGCKAKPMLLEGGFNKPDRWACNFFL